MRDNNYAVEQDFIEVTEAILADVDCGKTLIRKWEGISWETVKISYDECLEIIPSDLYDEFNQINGRGQCDTIICFTQWDFVKQMVLEVNWNT